MKWFQDNKQYVHRQETIDTIVQLCPYPTGIATNNVHQQAIEQCLQLNSTEKIQIIFIQN